MIDAIIWFMVIVSFVSIFFISFFCITVLRAVMKLMEKVDDMELAIDRKQNRPQPPPNIIPLEKM